MIRICTNAYGEDFKCFQYDTEDPTGEQTEAQQNEMTKNLREFLVSIERDEQHEKDGSIAILCESIGVRLKCGDWVIQYGNFSYQICTNAEFEKHYRLR